MSDFSRALRYAWPYRRRYVLSLLCGVAVALFWGANISAIYPILTILLENKTLVSWTDDKLALADEEINRHQAEIQQHREQLQQLADPNARVSLHSAIARHQDLLAYRETERNLYRRIRPWLVQLTPSDPFRTLVLVMGFVMASMLVKGLFDYWQEYLSGTVVQLAVFDLRNEFYRRTLRLDLDHFSNTHTHDLMAHFTSDIESLTGGMRALLGKIALEPLKALSCLGFACWFNWRLTAVTLLLVPLGAIMMGTIGRYLKKVSRRNLESTSRVYKILQESFLGIRVVKAFVGESRERLRYYRETKRNSRQSIRLVRLDALSGPVLELLALAAVAVALLAGAYLVLTGRTHILGVRLTHDPLTPGFLMTFYALLAGISDPLRKAFSVYGRVQRGAAAAERIFRCYDREPRIRNPRRAPALSAHRHSIEFHDVHFGYPARPPVLRGVSLRIAFGETLAIVGQTGCGKTSLINLVPRFYDPTQGRVTVDGQDLREVNIRSLREQIGLVTQQTILFHDTVAKNIGYGSVGATRAEIRRAADLAHATAFIETLPEGFDTMIGEMGASLSGGQRQRIAMARAILRDPPILILDEATSSLDVESESLIHQTLAELRHGRTTLMVTHRLSTLDLVDRIVVVADGRVDAVGTIDELLDSSLSFRRMYDVHAKGA